MENRLYKKGMWILIGYLALCWLVTVLQIFFFPLPRIVLLFLLLPVGVIGLFVYFFLFGRCLIRSFPTLLTALALIVVLILDYAAVLRPLSSYDLVKYSLCGSSYHHAAEILAEELENAEETDGLEVYEGAEAAGGLAGKHGVMYIKFGENLLISFTVSASLFVTTAYVYYTGPDILNYLDEPEKYRRERDIPIQGPMYKERILLDDPGWMYVIWT